MAVPKHDTVKLKAPAHVRELSIGPTAYAVKNGAVEVAPEDAAQAEHMLALIPTPVDTPVTPAAEKE